MNDDEPSTLRVGRSHLELTLPTDDHRVVDLTLDLQDGLAHALHHLLAARMGDARFPHRARTPRTLVERALGIVGAAPERIEVHPGEPPRFVLAVVCPDGRLQRLDLDPLDMAELATTRRIPLVAIAWPPTDWDAALRRLPG